MQLLIAALIGAFASAVASLVGRVLIALSLSFVTYKGLSVATDFLYAQMQSYFLSIPPAILSLLGYLWVDKAINLMFSAYTAALAIKMAGGTTIKKLVTK
jgi:hypothetical protein